MPQLTARSLLASAAQVASGTGAAVDIGADASLDLDLTVTAIAGGTLTVEVQTSSNSTVGWATVAMIAGADLAPTAFAVMSATGVQSVTFTDLKRYVRIVWTLGGGATATFAVTGFSVRVYARPADLGTLGLLASTLTAISSYRKDKVLREQTDRADSALAMQFQVPLETWGDDIKGGVSACGACELMAVDGVRPGQDEQVAKRCKMFDDWLDLVALGKRKPAGAVDLTPEEDEGAAYAVTDEERGWLGRYAW